jgi:hypothetical protein
MPPRGSVNRLEGKGGLVGERNDRNRGKVERMSPRHHSYSYP